MFSIILASGSPRRRELLDQIGVSYDVFPVDVDESPLPGELPQDLVVRLARLKAETGWRATSGEKPVLGADTLGVLEDQILAKPVDYEHAREMLGRMSANRHDILSAVALAYRGETRVRLSKTRVWFTRLGEQEIRGYWESGEPRDKAGAYAIQGYGATFVTRIEGSYSGVTGLPLYETHELLKELAKGWSG